MGTIIKIEHAEIQNALRDTTRQYFAGNLSRPQKLTFLRDERLEIGLSSYPAHQSEPAHRHSAATEYQYVISGWTQYMDVDTGEIHEFRQGDFYAILPETAYAQRVKAGTAILFIKTPSINDKQLADLTPSQAAWLAEKLRTVRTDYFHQADAPEVNSIRPAAAAAILNSRRELLMLHRRDNGKWTIPGGTMEFGESLTGCALREVREETGLEITIRDIIGTYTDPGIRVAYSDGEVRQEFTVVYYAETDCAGITLDEESSQYRWVTVPDALELPLAGSQRRRLEDVIRYLEDGSRKFI